MGILSFPRTTACQGIFGWLAGLAGGVVFAALLIFFGWAPVASAQSLAVLPDAKWLDFFCIGQEECAVGDFNGDGKDDLLAFVRDTRPGNEQGDVYVALSGGSGFLPATKWHDFFCVGPEVCKVGDFNGDGKDDIAAFVRSGYSGDAAGDVYVALSTGAGFLPSSRWHTFFCIGQEVCEVGDFNGDGKTDIASFARSSYSGDAQGDVYVALSSGTGFGAGARWHTFFCILQEQCGTGDFNGDGKDDIVSFTRGSNGAVYVALSSGSGFGSGVKWHHFFCVGEEVCGVGDFDGNGKDDIVTFLRNGYDATTRGDVYVALSSGGGFGSGVLWHDYFCVGQEICNTGDFDGDRRSDIVAFLRDTQGGDARGDVYVALAAGTPYRFEVSQRWHEEFCTGQQQCAVGDFNGDGRADILTFVRDTQSGTGQGDVYVALSTGLSFGPATKWHDFFCTGGEVCTVGDFNGDGKDDIVAFVRSSKTDATQGDVYVAVSDGTSFGTRTLWNTFFCLGNEVCGVGDFNGDGRDDIIAFMRSAYSGDPEGDVYVGLSNGYSFAGGVKWHSFFCIQWEQCEVGDFNGDGKDDILTYTRGSQGDVYVALSNGYSFGTSAKWHDFFCVGEEICGVGDFNGDRKDDGVVFTRSAYSGEAAGDVYVGLSTGSKFLTGPKWHDFFCIGLEVCAAGDFNGDSRSDIATFLRDTQTDTRRGDVYVALAGGDGYRFADVARKVYLPLVRR